MPMAVGGVGAATQIPELLGFVETYRWVWDVKLTELFVKDHLISNIPHEWEEVMRKWTIHDLHLLPFNQIKTTLPFSLRSFLEQCQLYSLSTDVPNWIKDESLTVKGSLSRNMKPKKRHEVSRLSGLIKKVCQESGCESVVDIGSGLGHLGRCLTDMCGLDVTSIERECERVTTANIRADSIHIQINSIQLDINDTAVCTDKLKELISSMKGKVCITGLHCCGDLSPHILKIFSSISLSSVLILIPCCYHKLSLSLPISYAIQEAAKSMNITTYLSVYALRLAAQNSLESWCSQCDSDHMQHQNRVAFRAIAEVVLKNDVLKAAANKVGPALRKLNYENFDMFVDSFVKLVKQEIPGPEHEITRDMLFEAYKKFSPTFPLIEPFTGLQLCMQRALESLVLIDYQLYLEEKGIETELVCVFDQDLSPRSTAIIGKRK